MTGRIYAGAGLIEVRQGDSFNIRFQLKQGTHPVDLRQSSINMEVRDKDGKLIFAKQADPIDAQKGQMLLNITPTDTNVPAGEYYTDIELRLPDGSVNTIFPAQPNQVATFRITKQITR